MRREAGRVGHWHTGSTQGTFQRAAEVAGAEKAGAASFGIPDAEPLPRWRVLFRLATPGHAEQPTRPVTNVVEASLEVDSFVIGALVGLPSQLGLGEAQKRSDSTAGSVPVLSTVTADLDQHHVGI